MPPKAPWWSKVTSRRLAAICLAALGLVLAGLAVRPAPVPPVRDRPLPAFESPRDLRRIVVLGTSLSAKYGWPSLFRDRLAACLDRTPDLELVARPGANSGWGLDQVARVIAANPDLVLIEFAINDADLKDGVWRAESAAHHRDILAELATALPDARVLLMTMSPVRGWQILFRPRLAGYYALYPEIGEETGAGVLDLYPRWLTNPSARESFPDGVHPTEAAATDILLPPLLRTVGQALGRDCAG